MREYPGALGRWLRQDVNRLLPIGVVVALAALVPFAFGSVGLDPTVRTAQFLLMLMLAVVILKTARLAGLARSTARFWRSIGVAVVTYAAGGAVDLAGSALHSLYGVAQVHWGAGIVFPIAGVVTMYALFQYPTTARTRAQRITVALDAGIVLLSTVSFVWYFSVSRQWAPGDSLLVLGSTLALPAMTLVAGFAMLKIAFVGVGVVDRAALILYGVSVGVGALGGALPTGPDDIAFGMTVCSMVSQVAALLGAAVQYRASRLGDIHDRSAGRRRTFSVLPYGASVSAFLLLVVVLQPTLGWRQWGVVTGAALLLGAVTIRQLVALRENGRLLADNRKLTAQLQRQAWYDELTGLANRTLYGERVRQALERADRDGVESAVLLIDLDDFKLVNDTLGHEAGDVLLREIAARLTAEVRPRDTVFRLGGDEFVVIAEDVSAADLRALAQRLVAAVAAPVSLPQRTVTVGASVGVALVSASRGDAGELLRRADVAMYTAKSAGKGNWRLAEAAYAGDSGR